MSLPRDVAQLTMESALPKLNWPREAEWNDEVVRHRYSKHKGTLTFNSIPFHRILCCDDTKVSREDVLGGPVVHGIPVDNVAVVPAMPRSNKTVKASGRSATDRARRGAG